MAEFSYSLSGVGSSNNSPFPFVQISSLYGLLLSTAPQTHAIYGAIPAGDLLLENGQLVFRDGIEQARQEIECRSTFFLGEYFLDTRLGVPYYRDVLVKNPVRETILSCFRSIALSVPGIVDVVNMAYDFDPRARTAKVSYEAQWLDGQPVPISFPLLLG